MNALIKPPTLGDVLKYEVEPNYTCEVITLLAGLPYPVGSVLGKITASGKYKLATSGGTDGAQTAVAVLLYPVDATLADAQGIVVARGASIVSRATWTCTGFVPVRCSCWAALCSKATGDFQPGAGSCPTAWCRFWLRWSPAMFG